MAVNNGSQRLIFYPCLVRASTRAVMVVNNSSRDRILVMIVASTMIKNTCQNGGHGVTGKNTRKTLIRP